MLFFGVIGFLLRQMKYPMVPLVLGLVLGAILDKSLRRGLTLCKGQIIDFFTCPIRSFLALCCFMTVLLMLWPRKRRGDTITATEPADTNAADPDA